MLILVSCLMGVLHPILEPSFQAELNSSTQSVLSVSDTTKLLVDGRESYPERWRMLDGAKKTIFFSTMYVYNDPTTKRLGDMLIRKKDEGVDVRMIVYGPYSFGNKPFYTKMRRHGIGVQMYGTVREVLFRNPLRFWQRHLHDKYLVVDGQEAIVGGMNWSARYERGGVDATRPAWRDTDILVTGPQAAIVHWEFLKRWYRNGDQKEYGAASAALDDAYSKLVYPGSASYGDYVEERDGAPGGYVASKLSRFLYQQPFEDNGVTRLTTFYKEMIDRAQSHIYWQSISIRPAPIQKEALYRAAARGVDVRLMTNSERNMAMIPIGGVPVYILTRMEYKDLLEHGVRIFEYSGDAPMHAKGFVVDGVVAAIGSYNATFTAEKFYTEAAVATYDRDAIGDVYQMFEEDFAHCREVTRADLEKSRLRLRHLSRWGVDKAMPKELK
jgi:cardiolipin synthase